MTKVKTYVGTDGKLHFVNSAGADSVLNFSSGKYNNIVSRAVSFGITRTSDNTNTYFSQVFNVSITDICPEYGRLSKDNIFFIIYEGQVIFTGPALSNMYISEYSYNPSTGIISLTAWDNNYWTSSRTYTMYCKVLVIY